MKFTVYETATGRVLRTGSCPDGQVALQAQSGETAVEGDYQPMAYRFDGGGAAVQLPARPSAFHNFDFSGLQWVLDSTAAWASVRRKRDAILAQSDWMTIRSQEGGPPMSVAWRQYRQQLRDITTQADPLNIVWPTPPAA